MVKDFFKSILDLKKEIESLESVASLGKYDLLPKIGELEATNQTSLFFYDQQQTRREKLISLRNIIYGSTP